MDKVQYYRDTRIAPLLSNMVRHLLLYQPQTEVEIYDALTAFLERVDGAGHSRATRSLRFAMLPMPKRAAPTKPLITTAKARDGEERAPNSHKEQLAPSSPAIDPLEATQPSMMLKHLAPTQAGTGHSSMDAANNESESLKTDEAFERDDIVMLEAKATEHVVRHWQLMSSEAAMRDELSMTSLRDAFGIALLCRSSALERFEEAPARAVIEQAADGRLWEQRIQTARCVDLDEPYHREDVVNAESDARNFILSCCRVAHGARSTMAMTVDDEPRRRLQIQRECSDEVALVYGRLLADQAAIIARHGLAASQLATAIDFTVAIDEPRKRAAVIDGWGRETVAACAEILIARRSLLLADGLFVDESNAWRHLVTKVLEDESMLRRMGAFHAACKANAQCATVVLHEPVARTGIVASEARCRTVLSREGAFQAASLAIAVAESAQRSAAASEEVRVFASLQLNAAEARLRLELLLAYCIFMSDVIADAAREHDEFAREGRLRSCVEAHDAQWCRLLQEETAAFEHVILAAAEGASRSSLRGVESAQRRDMATSLVEALSSAMDAEARTQLKHAQQRNGLETECEGASGFLFDSEVEAWESILSAASRSALSATETRNRYAAHQEACREAVDLSLAMESVWRQIFDGVEMSEWRHLCALHRVAVAGYSSRSTLCDAEATDRRAIRRSRDLDHVLVAEADARRALAAVAFADVAQASASVSLLLRSCAAWMNQATHDACTAMRRAIVDVAEPETRRAMATGIEKERARDCFAPFATFADAATSYQREATRAFAVTAAHVVEAAEGDCRAAIRAHESGRWMTSIESPFAMALGVAGIVAAETHGRTACGAAQLQELATIQYDADCHALASLAFANRRWISCDSLSGLSLLQELGSAIMATLREECAGRSVITAQAKESERKAAVQAEERATLLQAEPAARSQILAEEGCGRDAVSAQAAASVRDVARRIAQREEERAALSQSEVAARGGLHTDEAAARSSLVADAAICARFAACHAALRQQREAARAEVVHAEERDRASVAGTAEACKIAAATAQETREYREAFSADETIARAAIEAEENRLACDMAKEIATAIREDRELLLLQARLSGKASMMKLPSGGDDDVRSPNNDDMPATPRSGGSGRDSPTGTIVSTASIRMGTALLTTPVLDETRRRVFALMMNPPSAVVFDDGTLVVGMKMLVKECDVGLVVLIKNKSSTDRIFGVSIGIASKPSAIQLRGGGKDVGNLDPLETKQYKVKATIIALAATGWPVATLRCTVVPAGVEQQRALSGEFGSDVCSDDGETSPSLGGSFQAPPTSVLSSGSMAGAGRSVAISVPLPVAFTTVICPRPFADLKAFTDLWKIVGGSTAVGRTAETYRCALSGSTVADAIAKLVARILKLIHLHVVRPSDDTACFAGVHAVAGGHQTQVCVLLKSAANEQKTILGIKIEARSQDPDLEKLIAKQCLSLIKGDPTVASLEPDPAPASATPKK